VCVCACAHACVCCTKTKIHRDVQKEYCLFIFVAAFWCSHFGYVWGILYCTLFSPVCSFCKSLGFVTVLVSCFPYPLHSWNYLLRSWGKICCRGCIKFSWNKHSSCVFFIIPLFLWCDWITKNSLIILNWCIIHHVVYMSFFNKDQHSTQYVMEKDCKFNISPTNCG
jgi:hypothetical protein